MSLTNDDIQRNDSRLMQRRNSDASVISDAADDHVSLAQKLDDLTAVLDALDKVRLGETADLAVQITMPGLKLLRQNLVVDYGHDLHMEGGIDVRERSKDKLPDPFSSERLSNHSGSIDSAIVDVDLADDPLSPGRRSSSSTQIQSMDSQADGQAEPEFTRTATTITHGGGYRYAHACPDVGSRRDSFLFQPDGSILRNSSKNSLVRLGQKTIYNSNCYIHPERPPRLTWDVCSMGLILVLIVVIPFELAFKWNDTEGEDVGLYWINVIADLWFAIDLVLNCFTAVHKGKGTASRLITRPLSIMKLYVRGWLWIDLLATLPFGRIITWVSNERQSEEQGTEAMGMLRALRVAKATRMVKVLRALKLGGLMQRFEEQLVAVQSMTVAFQLVKRTVIMLLAFHIFACIWFMVGFIGEVSELPRILYTGNTWIRAEGLVDAHPFAQWVASFYFALITGTTVGYGDITATNGVEQICTCLLLIFSVAYISHFVARVGQIISTLNRTEAEMMKVKQEAMLFCQKRGVKRTLYHKVLRYIEHVHETDSITSLARTGFLEKLSESLQNELRLSVTGNYLKEFPLFKDAEDAFITAICQACHTSRAGIGDVVAQEGQSNDKLYLIVRGEVSMTQMGEGIGALRDEDWFGERALFFERLVHQVSIKCETDCEFLVLGRKEFNRQMAMFPKVQREYEKQLSAYRSGKRKRVSIAEAIANAAAIVPGQFRKTGRG